jgi:hypothetical protein
MVMVISCVVTYFEVLGRVCSTPLGLGALRILSLMTLEIHNISHPIIKVMMGGVGGGACILVVTMGLRNMSILDKYRHIYCHLLGFVVSMVMRVWLPSSFFMDQFWNRLILGKGIAMATLSYLQDNRTPLVTKEDLTTPKSPHPIPVQNAERSVWVWLGVGLGSHLFITCSIFGNAGILSRWSDYNFGSISQLILALLVGVVCLGMLLGNETNLDLICSIQWLIVGVASYLVMVYTKAITSIFGSLMMSLHVVSTWPQVYHRAIEGPPTHVLPVAMVTYIVAMVTSQAVIFGMSFMNFAVIVAMAMEWVGLHKWLPVGLRLGRVKRRSEPQVVIPRRPSYTMMFGRMIRRLSTVSEGEEDKEEINDQMSIHTKRLHELFNSQEEEIKNFNKKKKKKVMLLLVLIGIIGGLYSYLLVY